MAKHFSQARDLAIIATTLLIILEFVVQSQSSFHG